MRKLILVKLGGSLITDKKKPFTEDSTTIKRLVREIHGAREQRSTLLIVGHGGGSYPHVPAVKYKTAKGVAGPDSFLGIAEVQDAAARLNRIVVRELIDAGENAVSLSPSSFMISSKGKVEKAFLEPVLRLLEFKMLPVVYGDVVLDSQMGCSILSTEKILNFLANNLGTKFKLEKIVLCGRTDGVYGNKGETILKISRKNFKQIKKQIGASEGIDVTGGMIHKVEESLALAKKGIPSEIINGTRKEELLNVLLGKPHKGTKVGYN